MDFKAVIFDLDGTLLDTIEDLTDSMNAALAALGFPERSAGEAKRIVGDGIDQYVRRALPAEARKSEAAARLKELMRAEYKKRRAVKTRPYPEFESSSMPSAGAGSRWPSSRTSFTGKPSS